MKVEMKVAESPQGYASKDPGFIGDTNGSVFSVSGLGGLLRGRAVPNGKAYDTENRIIIQRADD